MLDEAGSLWGAMPSPISEARRRANEKYNSKAYDEIKVRVKKGQKEKIKNFAESQGKTTNGFISELINKAMARDNTEIKE